LLKPASANRKEPKRDLYFFDECRSCLDSPEYLDLGYCEYCSTTYTRLNEWLFERELAIIELEEFKKAKEAIAKEYEHYDEERNEP